MENNIKKISLSDSKDLIYKSNTLARSKYDITLIQARFIAFLSSFVDKDDEDFFTYQIQIKPVLDNKWTPYGIYKWRRWRDSLTDTETIYKDFFNEAEAIASITDTLWTKQTKAHS